MLDKIKSLKEQMHWGLAVYGKTVRAVGTLSNPVVDEKSNARQANRAGFM